VRVFVREIQVAGATVMSAEELGRITAPYVNRELTSEDLEALRLALTLAYVNKGYVTSGAIIPDQTVTEGVIRLQIVEGQLKRIEVEGNQWFRSGYLQDRLILGAGPPVNINALQQRLQLLQQDPRIQQINAELKPGLKLGESELKVRVNEVSPYRAWLEFNNFQSPSVGAERGLATVQHQNLTGNADTLSFTYGKSSGVDPQIDTSYALPLNAYDTTVIFQYRKNDFLVVEAPFESLDIKSKSEIFGVTLRQPVYRTLNQEIALALTGERLSNKTFLLGDPFSFTPGADNGESIVSAVRFAQEWTHRSQNQVIAARSRFSFGINALDSTDNKKNFGDADGQFFAWLGQFQWARQLGSWGIQLLSRIDLQLANDHLFPLEQMSVGGRYSVRGYRENTLVRDNAFLFSLESRIPALRSATNENLIQLAPFVDVGRSWNTNALTPVPETLASIGLGLIVSNILPGTRLEVYWGQPLNHVVTPEGNLQDHGVHVQVVWQVF
jgi:hemolysin activation/secretion protein